MRITLRPVFCLSCLFLLLISVFTNPVHSETINTITSEPSVNRVIIDGDFTSDNEWDDAATLELKDENNSWGTLYVKDDKHFLYILIRATLTDMQDHDKFVVGHIALCVLNDNANEPQFDDHNIVRIALVSSLTISNFFNSYRKGNGTNWIPTGEDDFPKIISESQSSISKYGEQIYIFEFAIPRQVFNDSLDIGFGVETIVMTENTIRQTVFPTKTNFDNPSTWGILTFATPGVATPHPRDLTC